MTELAFAKSFLSALDSRPVKLRADHVFDPERIGLRVPYTLPRLSPSRPSMPKKTTHALAPGSSKSITIHLKSARNPVLEFALPNSPLSTTSVQDLKDTVRDRVIDSQNNGVALDKVKILYKRKPVTGNKTVAEILADEPDMLVGGKEVEFGVMIIGGAGLRVVEEVATAPETTTAAAAVETETIQGGESKPAVVGPSGEEVLKTEAFWDDLQGFLAQRIKDEAEAKKLRGLFEGAWRSSQ